MINPKKFKPVASGDLLSLLVKSMIEKRKKLGWSTKILADKSNVPHSAIIRMENGNGYWEDYALQLNNILDKALLTLPIIDNTQIIENKKITIPQNDKIFTTSKPLKKKMRMGNAL